MKKGISRWCFKESSYSEIFPLAKSLGFDGVELTMDMGGELTPETTDELYVQVYSLSKQYLDMIKPKEISEEELSKYFNISISFKTINDIMYHIFDCINRQYTNHHSTNILYLGIDSYNKYNHCTHLPI